MTHRHHSFASVTPLRSSAERQDQAQYYYPPVPGHRQPAQTYYPHNKRSSDAQPGDAPMIQGSTSSTRSVSSGPSSQKHGRTATTQWPRSAQSATLAGSKRNDQYEQRDAVNSGRSQYAYRQSNMKDNDLPALAHARQREHIKEQHGQEQESDHALWILFWLSLLDPIHSLASCLFTLVTVFGLLLATPIRLFQKQSSLGDQIIRALAPIHRHHLEVMYAQSVEEAFSFVFSPAMLVFIQLVSPLISLGVMFAAWVSGAFWIFAFIMGNPDGTERHDDGADAVIALRDWWERVLLRALESQSRTTVRSLV